MRILVKTIFDFFISLLPESIPWEFRSLIIKTAFYATIFGYFISFPFNILLKKILYKIKTWLKEKRRDQRLAAKKIPGTIFLGEVTQYLDKLKVAVIKIKNKSIKAGDYIFIYGKTTKLTFQVNSLQINKIQVSEVKKRQEAGILVPKEVQAGDLIYKIKKKPK